MAVYFIQRQSGSIKIGMSKDVHRRFSELARVSEEPLKLLGYLKDGREWLLHQEFAGLREKDEWFFPGTPLLDFIQRHVDNGEPVPWDDMIKRAQGQGKVIPLRSQFPKTVRLGDFLKASDTHEVVSHVVETALSARNSGHPITVQHARIQGQRGILVFIPGYELVGGRVQQVAELVSAASPAEPA